MTSKWQENYKKTTRKISENKIIGRCVWSSFSFKKIIFHVFFFFNSFVFSTFFWNDLIILLNLLLNYFTIFLGKKPNPYRLDQSASNSNDEENRNLAQRMKMRAIAKLLLWVFPFFGIIFILGWKKVLDRDGVFIGQFLTLKFPFFWFLWVLFLFLRFFYHCFSIVFLLFFPLVFSLFFFLIFSFIFFFIFLWLYYPLMLRCFLLL